MFELDHGSEAHALSSSVLSASSFPERSPSLEHSSLKHSDAPSLEISANKIRYSGRNIPLRAVNYGEAAGNAQIMFFGDHHWNEMIRPHLAAHLAELKENGFTHFLIEAPHKQREEFKKFNAGTRFGLDGLDLGPDRDIGSLIFAARNEGLTVLPYDTTLTGKGWREYREHYIANKIAAILRADPEARLAVLIGGRHARPESWGQTHTKTARHKLERKGYSTTTIGFCGGPRKYRSEHPNVIRLHRAIERSGLTEEEFMIKSPDFGSGQHVPFRGGKLDFLVNLQSVKPNSRTSRSKSEPA